MILVDTSVWIDHLRDRNSAQVAAFREMLRGAARVATSGPVRMELLRGVHDDDRQELVTWLDACHLIGTTDIDFDRAASLHREARASGMSVRNSIDCLIAAPCIRLGVPLLHADADFDRLAAVSDLVVLDA